MCFWALFWAKTTHHVCIFYCKLSLYIFGLWSQGTQTDLVLGILQVYCWLVQEMATSWFGTQDAILKMVTILLSIPFVNLTRESYPTIQLQPVGKRRRKSHHVKYAVSAFDTFLYYHFYLLTDIHNRGSSTIEIDHLYTTLNFCKFNYKRKSVH